jgi:hypothetical protein
MPGGHPLQPQQQHRADFRIAVAQARCFRAPAPWSCSAAAAGPLTDVMNLKASMTFTLFFVTPRM